MYCIDFDLKRTELQEHILWYMLLHLAKRERGWWGVCSLHSPHHCSFQHGEPYKRQIHYITPLTLDDGLNFFFFSFLRFSLAWRLPPHPAQTELLCSQVSIKRPSGYIFKWRQFKCSLKIFDATKHNFCHRSVCKCETKWQRQITQACV